MIMNNLHVKSIDITKCDICIKVHLTSYSFIVPLANNYLVCYHHPVQEFCVRKKQSLKISLVLMIIGYHFLQELALVSLVTLANEASLGKGNLATIS